MRQSEWTITVLVVSLAHKVSRSVLSTDLPAAVLHGPPTLRSLPVLRFGLNGAAPDPVNETTTSWTGTLPQPR